MLQYIAVNNGMFETARILISGGASLKYTFPEGDTYLHRATRSGDVAATAFFLGFGMEVDVVIAKGETPLSLAVISDNRKVANALLLRGAATNKTVGGASYVWLAVKHNSTSVLPSLIEQGAAVDDKDSTGITPLYNATKNGLTECVRLLLQGGANVAVTDDKDYGRSVLHRAALKGNPDIARLLLEAGANVNVKERFGETPLHKAATCGNIDVVRVLLDAGADVNNKNNFGHTPLVGTRQ